MLNKQTRFQDLGLIEYGNAWQIQKEIFNELITQKQAIKINQHKNYTQNQLLFCEHLPVFTMGKSGKDANLLVSIQELATKNIQLFYTERGGDITFHGLGQLVVYPILDLDNFEISLRQYIYLLEEAVILLLKDYNIDAHRQSGASGVWIGENEKICAIGVRSSSMITMHGFALNINTDLQYFDYIVPCGLEGKHATSLKKKLGYEIDIKEIKNKLKKQLQKLIGLLLFDETT